MEFENPLVAQTAMLIRRPAHDCYEAFVDPRITSNFWFSEGSDRLDAGHQVTWTWAMYGASTEVAVMHLEADRKIVVEWDHGTEEATTVEWTFTDRGDGTTFVEIVNHGFSGGVDERIAKLTDTVGGFSLVLAGAKAWLEHNLRLGMIEDRHPDMLVADWRRK